jgi:metallo-beta-lactamase family protein
MCNAGRIKHHLRQNIERPESTILFVGFQAQGTLGRLILEGKNPVRIHGVNYSVRAEITQIHGFSAHADQSDLMRWISAFKKPPREIFVTHGEEEAALALEAKIRDTLGWNVTIPNYEDEVELA